jgi:hypothetical protein
MQREDVDPAVRPFLRDLDLPRRLPSEQSQSPINISGAPSVNQVALTPVVKDRRGTNREFDLHSEGSADPLDNTE